MCSHFVPFIDKLIGSIFVIPLILLFIHCELLKRNSIFVTFRLCIELVTTMVVVCVAFGILLKWGRIVGDLCRITDAIESVWRRM